MFTQVLWSPKEPNYIPAESNAGFQTSLTESRLSFRISEKKSESNKAAEMTVIF